MCSLNKKESFTVSNVENREDTSSHPINWAYFQQTNKIINKIARPRTDSRTRVLIICSNIAACTSIQAPAQPLNTQPIRRTQDQNRWFKQNLFTFVKIWEIEIFA